MIKNMHVEVKEHDFDRGSRSPKGNYSVELIIGRSRLQYYRYVNSAQESYFQRDVAMKVARRIASRLEIKVIDKSFNSDASTP